VTTSSSCSKNGSSSSPAPPRRAIAHVEAILAAALPELTVRLPLEAPEAANEPLVFAAREVYDRYRAFCRGYLRGGRVDDFFTHVLPRLELTEPAVYQALLRDAVDLESELLRPLERFTAGLLSRLRSRLSHLSRHLGLARLELEARAFAPLAAFEAAFGQVT
jgi:hypothetical protein